MPTTDITGRAVTRATEIVMRIRQSVEAAVPLGPNKVQVTPKELQKSYSTMTPDERQAFATSQGGIEDAMEMMNASTS